MNKELQVQCHLITALHWLVLDDIPLIIGRGLRTSMQLTYCLGICYKMHIMHLALRDPVKNVLADFVR